MFYLSCPVSVHYQNKSAADPRPATPAPRQPASFAQRPATPAPRPAPPPPPPPPSVQAQLNALATVVYAVRQRAANREEAELQMAQATLAQPFQLSGESIYKRRAAEVSAYRLAASQGLPQQPARQAAPTLPDADAIYRRRALQARGTA